MKKYTDLGAVTKGLNARKEQQGERDELNQSIQSATDKIATLTKTKYGLQKEQLQIESEVGSSDISQNSYTVSQVKVSLKMPSDGSSS